MKQRNNTTTELNTIKVMAARLKATKTYIWHPQVQLDIGDVDQVVPSETQPLRELQSPKLQERNTPQQLSQPGGRDFSQRQRKDTKSIRDKFRAEIFIKYPLEIKEALEMWTARDPNLSTRTTIKDQELKKSLVLLGIVTLPNRTQLFQNLSKLCSWSPTTALHYHEAAMRVRKDFNLQTSPADDALNQNLKKERHTWKTKRAPIIDLQALAIAIATLPHSLQTLVLTATTTGIRPMDVARLAINDIEHIRTATGSLLAITFRRHKTVHIIGPFSIHIKINEEPAIHITQLMKSRTLSPFLFIDIPPTTNDIEDDIKRQAAKVAKTVMTILRKSNTIQSGSFRRTASQELGLSLFPRRQIRLLTQHTSDAALGCYQDEGRTDAESGWKTADMVSIMAGKLLSQPTLTESKQRKDGATGPCI